MNVWDDASGTKSNTIPLVAAHVYINYDITVEEIIFIYTVIKKYILQNKEPV